MNWFITPEKKFLKGDVILNSNDEFDNIVKRNLKLKKKDRKFYGIDSEYKNLGNIEKVVMKGKKYLVTTDKGKEFILDLEFMDQYFLDNHLKNTQEYLKSSIFKLRNSNK